MDTVTLQEKELLLAKHEGWTWITDLTGTLTNRWLPPATPFTSVEVLQNCPHHYFTDPAATQRLVDKLNPVQLKIYEEYIARLYFNITPFYCSFSRTKEELLQLCHVTTAQRAEAVGLTCNLWQPPT